jgi:nucleotide-binding universal stress UspA family protein
MDQKIVALVDGSIYSASVCDHAAWISARMAMPVALLHVLGRRLAVEQTDLSGSIRLGARTALLEELAELDAQRSKLVAIRGRAILDDAKAILDKAGLEGTSTRLRHGDIVESVAEIEAEAAMILVGKRGEAADFAKGHLGSNLERIIRASHKPVLVASRAFRPVKKVLVAYDGGPSAVKAVDYITRNPLFAGLQIHLATVGGPSDAIAHSLADAKAILRTAGLDAQTEIVTGQPETALSRMTEDAVFDMVMMGAYGHSRVRNLIIGSTTTAMIRSCKVPVLLVR